MNDIEMLQNAIVSDRQEIDRINEEIARRKNIIRETENQYDIAQSYKQRIDDDFKSYLNSLDSNKNQLHVGSIFGENYVNTIKSCFSGYDVLNECTIMLSKLKDVIFEQDRIITDLKNRIRKLENDIEYRDSEVSRLKEEEQ